MRRPHRVLRHEQQAPRFLDDGRSRGIQLPNDSALCGATPTRRTTALHHRTLESEAGVPVHRADGMAVNGTPRPTPRRGCRPGRKRRQRRAPVLDDEARRWSMAAAPDAVCDPCREAGPDPDDRSFGRERSPRRRAVVADQARVAHGPRSGARWCRRTREEVDLWMLLARGVGVPRRRRQVSGDGVGAQHVGSGHGCVPSKLSGRA